MTDNLPTQVPDPWNKLEIGALQGVLMVVGAPDVGKSTFARYLFQRLKDRWGAGKVAFLDGDVGQSQFGPPATMSLIMATRPGERETALEIVRQLFVGAVSPAGHMLPVVVGAARLVNAAAALGAEAVVYDTSGLIDPLHGGLALKSAKIDLLRPSALFAIQRQDELQPLIVPYLRNPQMRVVRLAPSPAARSRDRLQRQAHRREQFAHYFTEARRLRLDWAKLAVFPMPRFSHQRLVALEDSQGFALGLGIVLEIDRSQRAVELLTPLDSLGEVYAVRLGDLILDPQTFEDRSLGYTPY